VEKRVKNSIFCEHSSLESRPTATGAVHTLFSHSTKTHTAEKTWGALWLNDARSFLGFFMCAELLKEKATIAASVGDVYVVPTPLASCFSRLRPLFHVIREQCAFFCFFATFSPAANFLFAPLIHN
jgi:hypothetical protein